MFKMSVLVVEDDKAVRSLISTALNTSKRYTVMDADTGKAAVMMVTSRNPDIIILDLGLPDMDGMEVIRNVRAWSDHPILVVSARSEDQDKIDALDAGADDYLTKPFSVDELQARIRVAIRKMNYEGLPLTDQGVFKNGALTINFSSTSVSMNGKAVQLTPIEYRLLCLLAKNVGRVLTHNYIQKEIWSHPGESDFSLIRVFMATLRKKIEKDSSKPIYIQTQIGIGYRMNRIVGESDYSNVV